MKKMGEAVMGETSTQRIAQEALQDPEMRRWLLRSGLIGGAVAGDQIGG